MRLVSYMNLYRPNSTSFFRLIIILFLDVLTLKFRIVIIILPTDWLETILLAARAKKNLSCLRLIQKNTLSKIAASDTTSSGSFEVLLLNKDESRISHLFMRSLNRVIKKWLLLKLCLIERCTKHNLNSVSKPGIIS